MRWIQQKILLMKACQANKKLFLTKISPPPIQAEKILLAVPAEALVVNLFGCDIEYIGTTQGEQGLAVYLRTDADAVFVQLISGDFTESLKKIFSQLKSTENIQVRIVGGRNAHIQERYIKEMLRALNELSADKTIFIVAQYLSKSIPQAFAFSLDSNALITFDPTLVNRRDQAWRQATVLLALMTSEEFVYPIRTVGYAEQVGQSMAKILPENFLTACLSVLGDMEKLSDENVLSKTFEIIPGPSLDMLSYWLQSSEGQQVIQSDLFNILLAAIKLSDNHYEKKEFSKAIEPLKICFKFFADDHIDAFNRLLAYLKSVSTHTDLILACIRVYTKTARSLFRLDQDSETFAYRTAANQAMRGAKAIAEQFLPQYLTEENEYSELVKEQKALKVKKKAFQTGCTFLKVGDALYSEKNYQKAFDAFQAGADDFKPYVDDPNYRYEAANCYSNMADCLVQGKQPGAAENAERAIAYYAQTAQAYLTLYVENKDEVYVTLVRDAAEKVFSTTTKFFPDQAGKKKSAAKQVGMLMADQGRVLFAEQKYQSALESFAKALTYFEPYCATDRNFLYESARISYNSALCHDNIGQKAKSIAKRHATAGQQEKAKEKYGEKLNHHHEALAKFATAEERFKAYAVQMQAQAALSDAEKACVVLANKMIEQTGTSLAGLHKETAELKKLAGYADEPEQEQDQVAAAGTPIFGGP